MHANYSPLLTGQSFPPGHGMHTFDLCSGDATREYLPLQSVAGMARTEIDRSEKSTVGALSGEVHSRPSALEGRPQKWNLHCHELARSVDAPSLPELTTITNAEPPLVSTLTHRSREIP